MYFRFSVMPHGGLFVTYLACLLTLVIINYLKEGPEGVRV